MIANAKLYSFYQSTLIRVVRISLLLFLLWLTVNGIVEQEPSKTAIASLSLLLMFEVFFRFKIARTTPLRKLSENDGKDVYASFTLQTLASLLSGKSTKQVIKHLLRQNQIQFMLRKANIAKKELPILEVSKEELVNLAFAISRHVNGTFVTTMDLFAAYLSLIEGQTKLLFTKELKEEEFLHILKWARFDYPDEERPKPTRVLFWGEGIGEAWVSGWTLETQKYTVDITAKVLSEKPVLIGRDEEYKETKEALLKKDKGNVLLVGEPGSGKTTLVYTLAFESFVGNLKGDLYHKRFLEVMTGALLAGATNQGELEKRLATIIEELSHAGNTIIFIPELQNILGATTYHLDLSGALIPFLKDTTIKIVATITSGNYKSFVESKPVLLDLFEIVKLEEPDETSGVEMLLEKAGSIERKYRVSLTYKAIVSSVRYASRYLQDKILPGSAVTLLTDAANSASLRKREVVEENDVVAKVEEQTKVAVAKPAVEEKELLLHLEDKLHERIIDQDEAVRVLSEAIRRIRTGLAPLNKPISFLFLGPTGVGKTETAKALSEIYFKRENNLIRLDMSEYASEDGIKRLLGAPPGEGEERGELTDKVHDNPFSLVLLDEFEKASPQILDLFLQVLDDGRLTDNKGKTVSFANAMMIATSNAASEFIREKVRKGVTVDEQFHQKLLEFLQTNHLFKPELLNRFDAVVTFKPLGEKEVQAVTKLLLRGVEKKLLEQDITVTFDEKAVAKIAKEGFDPQFGARPIRRFIQDNIEDMLSQKMLRDEIRRGNRVLVSVDASNFIQLMVS